MPRAAFLFFAQPEPGLAHHLPVPTPAVERADELPPPAAQSAPQALGPAAPQPLAQAVHAVARAAPVVMAPPPFPAPEPAPPRFDVDCLSNAWPAYRRISPRLGVEERVNEKRVPEAVDLARGGGHARLDEASRGRGGLAVHPGAPRRGTMVAWVSVPIVFDLDH